MNNSEPENIRRAIEIVAGIIRRIVEKPLDKALQASFTMEASREVK